LEADNRNGSPSSQQDRAPLIAAAILCFAAAGRPDGGSGDFIQSA
jgi:hypothetical protein